MCCTGVERSNISLDHLRSHHQVMEKVCITSSHHPRPISSPAHPIPTPIPSQVRRLITSPPHPQATPPTQLLVSFGFVFLTHPGSYHIASHCLARLMVSNISYPCACYRLVRLHMTCAWFSCLWQSQACCGWLLSLACLWLPPYLLFFVPPSVPHLHCIIVAIPVHM
jgi:hypothetical protein